MFRDCVKVETLDVSHFQTQRVLHMENMFYGCQALNEVLAAKRPSDRKYCAMMIELLTGSKKLQRKRKEWGYEKEYARD